MKLRHLVGGRLYYYYYYYYYYYCCRYDTLLWCLPIVPSSRSIPEWNMTGKIEIVATFIQLYGDKCGPLDMDQAWEWCWGHGGGLSLAETCIFVYSKKLQQVLMCTIDAIECYNAMTAWMLWQLECFDSLTALTAWMLWQLECFDSLNALTA